MAKKAKPIPKDYHTITPHLSVQNGSQAIEFYKKAFGAEEVYRLDRPDGKLMHAELKIGDSIFMLGDECDSPHPGHENCCRSPQALKGTTVNLFMYVKNVDAVVKQALEAGAKEVMPVTDMFWGDRTGQILDPAGHMWMIATHIEDVEPKEMERRARDFFLKKLK